jgi:enamine deaminase RidA (YjgF/YER057c/UK114 family)
LNGRPDACESRWRIVDPSGPAGWSRSIAPSSAARRTAIAVTSFVTDAQWTTASRGPCVATTSAFRTTPAAAVSAPQASICRSAFTAGDTRSIGRRNISSGSPYEPVVGFSRAVVVGDAVHVSGTAPVMPDGGDPPSDAYSQARRCLEIILEALREAGAGPEHVVRTRTFITSADHWEEVGRAHGEIFGDIRPASTMVVAQLLDPRWFVEIEAEAILPAG